MRSVQRYKVRLGPITASWADWSACQRRDLSRQLFTRGNALSCTPVDALMSERCVNGFHCGKSSLSVFTPVRRENRNKRRMEVRMKRVRHERHILREFRNGGRRQWLLLFFYPFWNCPQSTWLCLWSCSSTAAVIHNLYTFYKQLHRL